MQNGYNSSSDEDMPPLSEDSNEAIPPRMITKDPQLIHFNLISTNKLELVPSRGLVESNKSSSSSSDSGSDSEEGTDCEDDENKGQGSSCIGSSNDEGSFECLCIGCTVEFKSIESVLQHMITYHDFDLSLLVQKCEMDFISYAKMVNYIRHIKNLIKMNPSHEDLTCKKNSTWNLENLETLFGCSPSPWEDEKWLTTTKEDDGLLTLYIDEDSRELSSISGTASGDNKDTKVQQELEDLRSALERTLLEQNSMKEVMGRMVGKEDAKGKQKNNSKDGSNSLAEAFITEAEDGYYFESYDDCGIHGDMLSDHPRTLAYKDSIILNPSDFKDKTVMDLGCGTGILSMFCAQAGAKTVHAIDCSNIIYEAMDIIFENNFEKQIQCHKGKIETMSLNIDKVDILVSEWMGYFLIYEGMLNSYLYARDQYLKPGGKMLPSSAKISIVAVSDEEKYNSEIDMWNLVHGFKMSSMKKKALREPSIQIIPPESVVSSEVVLKDLDLHTCSASDSDINGSYEFKILKDCALTSVGGYFSCGFDDGTEHKVQLPTAPSDPPTHWKQCVFFLPQKIQVKKDETIPIKFICKPHSDNPRWLHVHLTVGRISASYEFR